MAGIPAKTMRIYSTDWSMTSGVVPMSTSIGSARNIPAATRTRPDMKPSSMAVCTVSSTSCLDFMPKYWATTTLPPADSPRNRFTIRLLRELVEPTAAMASLLSNCPTTTISAALNSSCSMPDSISGTEKRSSLPMRGPLHMSIVISRFTVRHLDCKKICPIAGRR